MLGEIVFRDAVIEDLPMIVEIYNSTISSRMVTGDLEPISVNDRLQWFHEHQPSTRPLWVVEYRGETCGWVSLQSFYGRAAFNRTAEVSIYFDERFRGNGLGKYALAKVIEACPELNIDTVLGYIFAHNEPSLRLFSHFQFEKWAHLPEIGELDGVKRDIVILGRKITKEFVYDYSRN